MEIIVRTTANEPRNKGHIGNLLLCKQARFAETTRNIFFYRTAVWCALTWRSIAGRVQYTRSR